MKIKFLKTIFLLALSTSALTSCVGDDDYVIPTVYSYAFNEGFETSTTGSGSTEVAISLEGWVNYNASTSTPISSRLWHARTFDDNIYAEFSSFYSTTGTNDVAWLITPAIDLTASTGEILSFATKTRFSNGYPMTAFISTDYDGTTTGIQLVKHPHVKAVGFTGSFKGGKALYDAAVSRPEPIPVYAEMGSSNPVFILPQAMKERGAAIAAGYSGSVTLGVGQFCTNPGILFHDAQKDDSFKNALKMEFEKTNGGVMLAASIFQSYTKAVEQHVHVNGVAQLAVGNAAKENNIATPVLFSTNSETFTNNPELSEEIFGPASIAVTTAGKKEMIEIAKKLSGHLTATVHGTEDELAEYKELIDVLEQKVGRLVINGFPTGVEVCSAMVHGGPFPSTTDSKSTSVGTAAIYRFTRPVCYQNMPDSLLPLELKNKNSLSILRLINGERTNKDLN